MGNENEGSGEFLTTAQRKRAEWLARIRNGWRSDGDHEKRGGADKKKARRKMRERSQRQARRR